MGDFLYVAMMPYLNELKGYSPIQADEDLRDGAEYCFSLSASESCSSLVWHQVSHQSGPVYSCKIGDTILETVLDQWSESWKCLKDDCAGDGDRGIFPVHINSDCYLHIARPPKNL